MVVCSLSTLLFNGNPLLRYDGYYVLADLLDVPNLGQQSRWLLGAMLSVVFLGTNSPPDRAVPRNRRTIMLLYAVASFLYGWFVFFGILWFVYRVLEPHGLKAVAQLFAAITIAGAVIYPAGRMFTTMFDATKRPPMRPARAVFSFGLLIAIVAATLLTPLPYSVRAPVIVESREAQSVYVVVPGRIESAVSAGQSVAAGQEIVRLVNLDLRKETADLAGLLRQQQLQLADLRLRLGTDPTVAAQIPPAEAACTDTETRQRRRQRQGRRSYSGAAPRSPGTVIPPPRKSTKKPLPGQLGNGKAAR